MDIVQRLRSDRGAGDEHWRDVLEAADEIERLRTIFRVNMLRHVPNVTHAEIDAQLNNDFKPAE